MGWVKYLLFLLRHRIDMNSFEVNTLPYMVHTLLTYKTSDRYKGFRIQLKEEEEEENKPIYLEKYSESLLMI